MIGLGRGKGVFCNHRGLGVWILMRPDVVMQNKQL